MCQRVPTKAVEPRARASASNVRCLHFSLMLLVLATFSSQFKHSIAFSVNGMAKNRYIVPAPSFASHRQIGPSRSRKKHAFPQFCIHDKENNVDQKPRTTQRICGYKRALLRKYGTTIALVTTLLCGPMSSIPSARRITGSTAHAASSSTTDPSPSAQTAADDGSAYNLKDFKDIKRKLSLAPGAVVEEYEDILAKVEAEGEKAWEDGNYAKKQTAFSIRESAGGGNAEPALLSMSSTETKGRQRASKKAPKKKQKESQFSEWELDEFGYDADGDDDFDHGVMSFNKSKKIEGNSIGAGKGGDAVATDKMAFSSYKATLPQEEKIKTIKKGTAYTLLPILAITTIRGQIRAYRERKWVQKGLAIVEEERQKYLEEKKKKKEDKKDDNNDDDDDDDESDDRDNDDDE